MYPAPSAAASRLLATPPPPPPATPTSLLAGTLAQLSARLTFLYLTFAAGPWNECGATAQMGARIVLLDAREPNLPLLLARVAQAVRAPAATGPHELGELLLRLARRCRSVSLSFPRADDACPFCSASWLSRTGTQGRGGCAQPDLADVLREAAGEPEPEKVCPQCRLSKPLSDYPRDRSRPTGRFSWCRDCNRRHVRAYHRRGVN